jgi:ubiquinone/menaquinone biosynthesis C-methylase UbiE
MNFKHLLPSFRNRYQFVMSAVQEIAQSRSLIRTLNLGTGEGDFDSMLAGLTVNLICCDINEQDIAVAKVLNAHVTNLNYEVRDALNTEYADEYFDLLVCTEVLEHVGTPDALIQEMYRIVKPDGYVVMTFPWQRFPWTYDPVNFIAQVMKLKKMPYFRQGAYAFGHEYLIDPKAFKKWISEVGFVQLKGRGLSGYLVGLLEMYWTGWLQRLIKFNASNDHSIKNKQSAYIPQSSQPSKLTCVTDGILKIDQSLFSRSKYSIGLGVVLYKNKRE